ncbi:hypothetical protein yberc0001_11700 [Yersinia bercovieri ATCC 43970]|uniref:Uncharacterized protein n=1 Tax=Yersinia bercovieri ATCC 43970 TaxID=349968 RepID=A0ABM9XU69_YERBE|nr:hypothetical protein yberc0001_11700 [Yersinia bercovieri ATCC 43970]
MLSLIALCQIHLNLANNPHLTHIYNTAIVQIIHQQLSLLITRMTR